MENIENTELLVQWVMAIISFAIFCALIFCGGVRGV